MNEQNPYVDFNSVNYQGTTEKKKITADLYDKLLAAVSVVLGYTLVYCATGGSHGVYFFSAFSVLYAASAYAYIIAKGKRPALGSLFWCAVLIISGVMVSFYSVWYPIQIVCAFFIGAYFTMSAAGALIDSKTSSWIVRDVCKALFTVPFGNYGSIFSVIRYSSGKKSSLWKKLLYILIGVALSIPVLMVIIPLLSSADAQMSLWFSKLYNTVFDNIGIYLLRFIISIPFSMYIFGLIYGAVNRRNTDRTDKKAVYESRSRLRKIPDIAVYTGLIIVCAVYVMFIGLQGSYLIQVLMGLPGVDFSYSEYARQGFFDLCKVSAFNLIVLYLANMFSVTETKNNRFLKILNAVASFLTLLLISTAMSKMFLYIVEYGLTLKRILTSLFMLWLAIVFIIIAVRQVKTVKLVRPACIAGAVIYTMICILPLEYIIYCYNTAFGY